MGAVLVIALFYTHSIAWPALGMAALILAGLVGLNLCGVRRLSPFLLLGVALWFFVHASRVHATIAGVLLAFTIPTRTQLDAEEFSTQARRLLHVFERTETGDRTVLTSKGQQDAIVGLERASQAVTAPLLRLEDALHGVSAFVVMPLFAFANSGVSLEGGLSGGVAVPVILGLMVGKTLGITTAAVGMVRLRLASLPDGVNWTAVHGCAWLGGIGFTMSLFIATLAFEGTALLDSARVGILSGPCSRAVSARLWSGGASRSSQAPALRVDDLVLKAWG